MEIKQEIHRRIADLTRLAYERGYRDGAQAALSEIESIAAADLAEQMVDIPEPLELVTESKPAKETARPAASTPAVPKVKRSKPKEKEVRSKQAIVGDALHA